VEGNRRGGKRKKDLSALVCIRRVKRRINIYNILQVMGQRKLMGVMEKERKRYVTSSVSGP
jgi:hypothetical protein